MKSPAPGLFGTLLLGLRVLASELSWIVVRVMRRAEMRQLEKRLDQERTTLTGLASGGEPRAPERELSEKQIAFLEEEIDFLAREMAAKRADMVARRTAAWGLE
ncbi:hypothetical protein dsx2_0923 [Desulfovibrio sp. X2]|uniref:hypothetical protein n=1 Tax=Desulfovibrio sp. X2 TaxID=941449 RepID=UPI000358C235|nr:hypothetical protein [Desulfovibrio sp. X2]EPR37577.1 hypothetical protein dsx2_0923 [Desulfovibrio sp. X2]